MVRGSQVRFQFTKNTLSWWLSQVYAFNLPRICFRPAFRCYWPSYIWASSYIASRRVSSHVLVLVRFICVPSNRGTPKLELETEQDSYQNNSINIA
jgi:hypothetical protein